MDANATNATPVHPTTRNTGPKVATRAIRPARLASRRARIVWPLVAVLIVVAVARFALAAHDDGGVLAVVVGLAAAAVILALVALLTERRYLAARRQAEETGLPFVMPSVVRRRDLPALGGWAGGLRTANPAPGYLATDGDTLRWFPVRWTRIHKWVQPFTVDLTSVTGTDATQLPYGARKVSAVVFHLGGPQPAELTVGCTNWQKAGVEHSPLSRYVSFAS